MTLGRADRRCRCATKSGRSTLAGSPARWRNRGMFVQAHQTLPMSAARACPALDAVLQGHVLQQGMQAAVAEGLEAVFVVGPAATPSWLTKTVQAAVLPPRLSGATTVIGLRWQAQGRSTRLFPVLDANIGVTGADELTCVLSIVGSYTPPLGPVGATLDHIALSRVARATIESFLRWLAHETTRVAAPARV